ncbi:hypothetical protein B0J13DRAFT_331117 [Dactylonectria estremocensis]|uniref:Uncharacterized protein n=1 Tax=Dactylonectria estremocensis TaxID=1079267 RepID=A0A9P9EWH6_9HYPO|nr:hypothetical protein B0J13DRAFT_331117 [Dactylonectria estremocensis]
MNKGQEALEGIIPMPVPVPVACVCAACDCTRTCTCTWTCTWTCTVCRLSQAACTSLELNPYRATKAVCQHGEPGPLDMFDGRFVRFPRPLVTIKADGLQAWASFLELSPTDEWEDQRETPGQCPRKSPPSVDTGTSQSRTKSCIKQTQKMPIDGLNKSMRFQMVSLFGPEKKAMLLRLFSYSIRPLDIIRAWHLSRALTRSPEGHKVETAKIYPGHYHATDASQPPSETMNKEAARSRPCDFRRISPPISREPLQRAGLSVETPHGARCRHRRTKYRTHDGQGA